MQQERWHERLALGERKLDRVAMAGSRSRCTERRGDSSNS
jgi:hypothetical protein